MAFDQITINTKLISNGQTDFNKQWLKNVGGIWFGSADSSSVLPALTATARRQVYRVKSAQAYISVGAAEQEL